MPSSEVFLILLIFVFYPRKLKKAFDAADESKVGSLSSNQTLVALKAFTGMNLSLHHVETLVKSLATTKGDQEKTGDKRNSSNLNLCHSEMTNGENRVNAVDFELFCSVLAEIMEDSEYTDNTSEFNFAASTIVRYNSAIVTLDSAITLHYLQLSSVQVLFTLGVERSHSPGY